MSFDHHRGEGWAYRELMRKAQADIDQGRSKGAKVLWKMANPAKVMIVRRLRGELKRWAR